MGQKSADQQPATKAFVREAVDELAVSTKKGFDHVDDQFAEIRQDISVIKKDVNSLKKGQARLEKGLEAVLNVVQSIDQQLKEHKTIPTRVARLERTVFRA